MATPGLYDAPAVGAVMVGFGAAARTVMETAALVAVVPVVLMLFAVSAYVPAAAVDHEKE